MSKNIFNSIRQPRVGSNWFDISHNKKMSFEMGYVVPMTVMEVMPGDKFSIGCSHRMRFAPLVSPVMHDVRVKMEYFYVPNRILWDNWNKFIFENDNGSTTPPALPTLALTAAGSAEGRLSDYLGLPKVINPITVSALPFAAYQAIYNEFYRDQNLVDEVDYKLVDGSNPGTQLGVLRKRAWMHDYFTAALPFAQRGEDVSVPLGDTAAITTELATIPFKTAGGGSPAAGPASFDQPGDLMEDSTGQAIGTETITDNFQVDLSGATATSIRNLRRAFKLQEWLEKSARSGNRAVESLLSYFGVKSSDARLDRPELIGSLSSQMTISEVLQTSESGSTPLATMAGHGLSQNSSGGLSKYCEEHGWIIGICSVMPRPAYQQGVPKYFLKTDPFDYPWPTFQHIGEQAVENRELYVDHSDPDGTFGYVPRYAEMKYIPDAVHGDFKTTLSHWTMTRIFDSEPNLNQSFIEMDPTSVDRVFAVQDNSDKIWAEIQHSVRVRRKLAKYGNPHL